MAKAATKAKTTKAPAKAKRAKKNADEVLNSKPVIPAAKAKKPAHPDSKWYVLYAQSNYENSVCEAIKQRVDANDMSDMISEVLVPTQKKIVVKNGKQSIKEERIFPGYVLIKMVLEPNTWSIIASTEGVRGFVKTDKLPRPLPEKEVQAILKFMEVEQPAYKASFGMGEAVKIIDGAFADFIGSVKEIDNEKGKVTVMISFLGREAPVELEFGQVSKL